MDRQTRWDIRRIFVAQRGRAYMTKAEELHCNDLEDDVDRQPIPAPDDSGHLSRRSFLVASGAVGASLAAGLSPHLFAKDDDYQAVLNLRQHIQWAIEVEHATIPTYLCALYSIKEGHNQEIASLIRSIVVEEMLHMSLACNLLNAVGGSPSINHEQFVPTYPAPLPHSDATFVVPLEKFSLELTENVFLKIECPSPEPPKPQTDNWTTIGQFYQGVEEILVGLYDIYHDDLFCGDPARQVTVQPHHTSLNLRDNPVDSSWTGKGDLYKISGLAEAKRAVREILDQGEGFNSEIYKDIYKDGYGEASHYGKFSEIVNNHKAFPFDPNGVWPMGANPKMMNYPVGSKARKLCKRFNVAYSQILDRLHQAFNGTPAELDNVVIDMFTLKQKAVALMQVPVPRAGFNAGPSFEYIKPEKRDGDE